ncbi:MAG: hypothetical protein AABZ74_08185 [Cyanobacteriota bacterium]
MKKIIIILGLVLVSNFYGCLKDTGYGWGNGGPSDPNVIGKDFYGSPTKDYDSCEKQCNSIKSSVKSFETGSHCSCN